MERTIRIILLMALAMLILIQKDVDGDLLINSWKGLAFANIMLIVGAAYEAVRGILGDAQ